MGRPIIGITGELDAARWGDWLREAAILPVSYIRAVERAGGAPLIVPPVPPASVASFTEVVDGLVFTGGRDVDPALYDQERHEETDEPDQRRDRFELALMRAALDAGVPFLAIGRGLHILTLARGGTLSQHLPGHRAARARRVCRSEDVAAMPGTVQEKLRRVNLMHRVPAAAAGRRTRRQRSERAIRRRRTSWRTFCTTGFSTPASTRTITAARCSRLIGRPLAGLPG